MTTVLILILSAAVAALLLWGLNRVIDSDGLGHRPPPRSHYSDPELHSTLWYADTRSAGISWLYSEARRSLRRRLQPHH